MNPGQAGFDEHCLWQVDKLGSRYWDPVIDENGDLRTEKGNLVRIFLSNISITSFGIIKTDRAIVSQFQNRSLQGGKGLMNDRGTHVPLIVSWPDHLHRGRNTDLVDFTDFLPTLLEAAGIVPDKPVPMDGKILVQLLRCCAKRGAPKEI